MDLEKDGLRQAICAHDMLHKLPQLQNQLK